MEHDHERCFNIVFQRVLLQNELVNSSKHIKFSCTCTCIMRKIPIMPVLCLMFDSPHYTRFRRAAQVPFLATPITAKTLGLFSTKPVAAQGSCIFHIKSPPERSPVWPHSFTIESQSCMGDIITNT